MKQIKFLMTIILLCLFSTACTAFCKKVSKTELTTQTEKISYVIGMDVGMTLKKMEEEIDLEVVYQAIEDSLEKKELLLAPEEAAELKKEYARKTREQRARTRQELSEKNMEQGRVFLAENGVKEGVVTTESGLQYMVLTEADGPKPQVTDKVSVHYQGTLIDGTEFDNSYKRDKPATFKLNGVIKGWTEGLQLMPVGSRYRFFIPSELAYGERGGGRKIGPHAVLLFDVELLGIQGPAQAETGSE